MPTRYDVSAVPPQGSYVAKQCPVRAQNDVLLPAVPLEPSPYLARLFTRGLDFEAAVFDEILTKYPGAVLIEGDDTAAREAATVAALASGDARVIVGGRLPLDAEGHRTGKPDVLVGGSGGWRPIDVKFHMSLEGADPNGRGIPARCSALDRLSFEDAVVDPDVDARKRKSDLLQLAHYQRMLEASGHAAGDGRFGGIIGTERRVVWYDLDSAIWRTPSSTGKQKLRTTMEIYDFEFDFRLDIIAVAQQHAADRGVELLVVPVRVWECDTCPWFDHCMPVLHEGAGDVSLLPRVQWREWKALRDAGVMDRADLAALDESMADEHPSAIANLPELIDLARAAVGSSPVYRRRGVDEVVVPRGDVEIDIDMENTEDGCYLWGTLVSGEAAEQVTTPGYRPFLAALPMTPAAETANFVEFWEWLTEVRRRADERGLVVRAYCYYAGAENRFLRSCGRAAGVGAEVEEFIASDHWVDLLQVFNDQFITGGGHGLKQVAPFAGFEWTVDDPGGGESMLRYDQAASGDASARDWLLTYNRNDVEATLALREWLSCEGDAIPSIESWGPLPEGPL